MNVTVHPASENVSNATAMPDDTKCSWIVKVEQLTCAFDLMGIILKKQEPTEETAKSAKIQKSFSGLTRDNPQKDALKQINFSRLRTTLQLSKLTAEAFWSRPWRYCRRPARQSFFGHRASHRVGDSSVVGG